MKPPGRSVKNAFFSSEKCTFPSLSDVTGTFTDPVWFEVQFFGILVLFGSRKVVEWKDSVVVSCLDLGGLP